MTLRFPQITTLEKIQISPSLDQVKQYMGDNHVNCVPIFSQIPADLLTPVMAFLKISEKSEYSFLLESIMGGEAVSRYSFIGAGALNKWFSLRMRCGDADHKPQSRSVQGHQDGRRL